MTPRRAITALITIFAALIVVTACSNGAPTKGSIDSTVQTQLRRDIATLAAAAAAHNTAAAQAALTALDSDAAAAHTAGKLSDAKLAQIRAAEATLQADLASSSPTTPAPITPSITASPTPTDGKSKGKGNGNGNGDGGD
jgi:hypothetical protein